TNILPIHNMAFARVNREEDPLPFNNEEIGNDLDGSISDHSRRMRELESNPQIAAHRLQWAENQLKEERRMFHANVQARVAKTNDLRSSDQKKRDHSPEEDGQSRQSRLSDENIRRAVENVNNPAKRKEETQGEYKARLAAQVRIQRKEIREAELKNRKHKLEFRGRGGTPL